MNLPTECEINPIPEDLDGKAAVRHFLGKSREQITEEFSEYGLSYQEDLMFMGSTAFCYYFPAALNYVMSSECNGDSDVISSLTAVLEQRLEFDLDTIKDAFPDMVKYADYVLHSYDSFDINLDIYGDLRPRLKAIQQKCGSLL